jgi:hypothetical protein
MNLQNLFEIKFLVKQKIFLRLIKIKMLCKLFNEFCKWLGIEYVYDIDSSSSSSSLVGLKKRKIFGRYYIYFNLLSTKYMILMKNYL